MLIFKITRAFPKEECYSLTSQIIRSSRSVCSNLAEGYRKRQYPAHFISKISDADMENSEIIVWIDFALKCGYIDSETATCLHKRNEEIGKMLNFMIKYPEKYRPQTSN